MSDPRYSWSGWNEGAHDCYPPEPGKEWIQISDHGEEMAIIVHRPSNHPDSEKWRLDKERHAQLIVDALNWLESPKFYIALVDGYDEPIPLGGPYPSYDAAVQAHFESVLEALGDHPQDVASRQSMHEVGAHQFYLTDDAVRIARVN